MASQGGTSERGRFVEQCSERNMIDRDGDRANDRAGKHRVEEDLASKTNLAESAISAQMVLK